MKILKQDFHLSYLSFKLLEKYSGVHKIYEGSLFLEPS